MSQSKNKITDKMAKLDELLAWFSGDQFNIDQAMKQYEVAESLAQEIELDLGLLKNEVEVLKKKFDIDDTYVGN